MAGYYAVLAVLLLITENATVEKRVSEPEPTLKAPTIDSKYSVQALSLLAEVNI